MRFSTFLRVPYSEVGCWSFHAGYHLAVTYSPSRVRAPLQVDLGHHDQVVTAAALERPLLGLCAPLGQEDAGGALPLALLVADLIALMGVAGGRRDNHDPGHVPCLLVTVA
jgi:hypothetical protein